MSPCLRTSVRVSGMLPRSMTPALRPPVGGAVVVVMDLVPVLVGEVQLDVDREAVRVQPDRGFLAFLDPQPVGIEQDLDLELAAIAAVRLGNLEPAVAAGLDRAPAVPPAPPGGDLGAGGDFDRDAGEAVGRPECFGQLRQEMAHHDPALDSPFIRHVRFLSLP